MAAVPRSILAIVAFYLVLGTTYSAVTPLFESPDEIYHFPLVRHLGTTHRLPIQDPQIETLWEQEGGQPPLYYALTGLVTAWIDTSDLPDRLFRNPHAQIGVPLAPGSKNVVVHMAEERFPWRGTALAVHLIRLLSVLFGAVAVFCTYLTAREIFGDGGDLTPRPPSLRGKGESWEGGSGGTGNVGMGGASLLAPGRGVPLLAAAIVAFNPMFLFIMGSVNNDSLAAALGALAVLLLVRLLTRGPSTRRWVSLGIVMGLGALTKMSLLGLLPLFGLVVAVLWWRQWRGMVGPSGSGEAPSPRSIVLGAGLTLGLVAALAGWWYLRNYQLYGDPTGFNVWLQIVGGRSQPMTVARLLREFKGLRISFWGNFGWVNIIAPEPVYVALDFFSLLAVLGLLVGLLRRRLPALLAVPTIWLGIEFAALIRWTSLTHASQGRLLFPALSAIAMLLASGMSALPVEGFRSTQYAVRALLRTAYRVLRVIPLAFVIFVLSFAVMAPFVLIAPAYAPPPRVPVSTETPNPVHITFEDQIELVGYELPARAVAPGGRLELTLYWRALVPIEDDFSVFLHLRDAHGEVIGQWDALPGNGLYPPRLWTTDEIIVDRYEIPVGFPEPVPQVGRVEVGLYRLSTLATLAARDPNGNLVTASLARVKIAPPLEVLTPGAEPDEERPAGESRVVFGEQIELGDIEVNAVGRDTDGGAHPSMQVEVTWRVLQEPNRDYTVFVHLLGPDGAIVAQADAQPAGGIYPTSFWSAGETIEDSYTLDLSEACGGGPCGDLLHRIAIGWYDPAGGTRLAIEGTRDAYVVENIRLP